VSPEICPGPAALALEMGVCRLETAELALVTAAFVLEAAVPVVGAAAAAAGGPGAGPGTAKAGHHLYGPWSCFGSAPDGCGPRCAGPGAEHGYSRTVGL